MKKGFTMAEALNVLVIIGVIAAITIPALTYSIEQHKYKTAFRKAIAQVNEALLIASETKSAHGYTTAKEITKILKRNMSLICYKENAVLKNFDWLFSPAYAAGSPTTDYVFIASPVVFSSPTVEEDEDEDTPAPDEEDEDEKDNQEDEYTPTPSTDEDEEESTAVFSNPDICSGHNVWTTTDGIMFCVAPNYKSENKELKTSICNKQSTVACSSDGNANLFIDVSGVKNPNELTLSSKKARDIFSAMIYAEKIVPYGDAAQEIMGGK